MPLLKRRSRAEALARVGTRAGTISGDYGGPRPLTASAQQVIVGDREQASALLLARQAWQSEAWVYRRNLGELRYASSYLANSCMRLRLHPAIFVEGDAEPLELTDENAAENGIPPELLAAARDCLLRLGAGGPMAQQIIQKRMAENFEIAGECYLIGETNPLTGKENWQIFSISQVTVNRDGNVGVREMPVVTSGSNQGVRWLASDSVVVRLWWPDPEFGMLADSPVKAILDLCEELLLLGQDVRATARSRLANNGILFLPDTLMPRRTTPNSETEDPNADPVLSTLIEAATASLTNEGSASAVVPIIVRGPEQAIAAVKHLPLSRPANVQNIQQRQELIGRMATGIDLPAEVLTGKVDLNHWTAWQVDDDAFRHHIEPLAIVQVDALTAGYLWMMLDAYGQWDPDLVRKIVIWYDPRALVTHPDETTNAKMAFDGGAIGRDGLRHFLSIGDEHKPNELDEILFVLEHARGVDPSLLTAVLKTIAKTIVIPDVQPKGPNEIPPGEPGGPPLPPPPADSGTTPQGPPPDGPPSSAPADGSGGAAAASAGAGQASAEGVLTASQLSLIDAVLERVL